MKVTLNWLKHYVDVDGSPESIADRLTMLGLEVEGVSRLSGEFEGIVVAEVLTRDKHPNADKLSVCRVHDGTGERQIVCGAQNFQAGDKVPLILPGSALPLKAGEKDPFVIKVGKIRGVESHGMMCSADELGLDPESLGLKKEDGLLILPPESKVGQPLATALGRSAGDVLFDLEVTPNRPDLNSVLGIARDWAAVTGGSLRLPDATLSTATTSQPPASACVAVRVEAPDLCPRYTARILRGVRVGPSPAWLREALEKVGLRSINNVVDVTNFVMWETGQPLHAFDFRLIARGPEPLPTLVVRRAVADESFIALDGKAHRLTSEDLLIADPEKGIALAGVMGGQNTEVSDQTTEILLESAYFAPTGIRRTSKTLGIRSDASYRFERGADPNAAAFASARAAALILQVAGGSLAEGMVDSAPELVPGKVISLRHDRVNAILGLQLTHAEIEFYLGQLGLKIARRKPRAVDDDSPPEPASFQIPTFRVDLKREIDLVEEVARLHGVEKVPSTPPRQARGSHPFDTRYDELMEVRRLLCGLGLHEVQAQTLISRAVVPASAAPVTLALANPLSSDMDVLRPSLLPGLVTVLHHNVRHQTRDLALFELGRVFRSDAKNGPESWRLALALTGARHPAYWSGTDRDARFDASDLKGLLEELFDHLGLRGMAFIRRPEPVAPFVESAQIALGGKLVLGELGQLHPAAARTFDLRDPVFLAELDLDQILARRNAARSFKSLPAFPATRRDLAMLVDEKVTHDDILLAVRQAKAAHLESIELFDVFRGQQVPAGRKSVAYAFTYRAPDKTLTDAEANAAHEKVLAQLRDRLGATLRE